MAKQSEPAGLAPRLAAIAKLRVVLGGENFSPLSEKEVTDSRDRALANRLVTVALRRHGHLNKIITQVLQKGMPARSGDFEMILRIGLTELLFLPAQAAHSALFLSVEAAKRDRRSAHLAKLLNGVLRRVQREAENFTNLPEADLFPDWLKDRWQKQYGADVIAGFGAALLETPPLDVTLRDEDPELIEALGGAPLIADSVRIAERDKQVVALPGFAEGRWWVQDVAAALPARLMNLPDGVRVLDMCAAPGGKTAQLAKAGFDVTALDLDGDRLQIVGQNLSRLGFQARLRQGDGAFYKPSSPFSGVLLDAPCSATGTFRRHPEVLWNRTAKGISGRVSLQKKLIEGAARYLKSGGILIYSVCSLEAEEGEAQADWVSENVAELELLPIKAGELSGLSGVIDAKGRLRTYPGMGAPNGVPGTMDGFFVARFRRR